MSKWKDDKVFNLGKVKVHSTKAENTKAVKWHLEVHKDGVYWSSHGSRLPFRFLAAIEAVFKMPRSPND